MSLVVYRDLPDQIAIHWDGSGNPDNFAPKALAAFGLPFLFVAINLFSKLNLFNDPRRAYTSPVMYKRLLGCLLFCLWSWFPLRFSCLG